MSRMERIKNAIAATTAKLCGEVKASHEKGKIPADYSLGFCNAFIFCDHHLNMRDGEPKFFDRTTSIGALPKPTVLKAHSPHLGADAIYEEMRDKVILAARNYFEAPSQIRENAIKEAIKVMDDFIDQMVDLEEQQEAGMVEVAATPDAGAESQESSILSPAAIQGGNNEETAN